MEVFGSSGVRGVANDAITPAFAVRLARSAGTVWRADRVAIGRDTRTSGRMLAAAVESGLTSVGSDVDHLGVVPTPGVQAYAAAEAVPAIVVTASHNPPEYNGFKLIDPNGSELAVAELERIETVFGEESFETASWDGVGRATEIEGANRRYVEAVLEAVDARPIAEAGLTVAVDPGHGAGSLTSPGFFRELGCEVVTVNAQPDGRFPGRHPEPVPERLGALRRLVRAADADVGVAHDGDADRSIFIDERGEDIEGDAAFAALASAELGRGDVAVSAVTVSQRLVDVVEAAGARLELTPVGSTRIVTRIRDLRDDGEDVAIAGEGNGGIVFPDYRLARDGAYTAARFLALVADSTASEVVTEFSGYHNVRANVPYRSAADRDALMRAAEAFAETADADLSTADGYRLDYGDGWVLIRPSGTEPLVRIYAEARERDRARELSDRVRTVLGEAVGGE